MKDQKPGATKLTPVILAGGVGARLWPLSRESMPKQFLDLTRSGRTLFQETLHRVSDRTRFEAPILVGNVAHRFLAALQAREAGVEDLTILLEPEGRNTAAAVAAACAVAAPDAVLLIMPADHDIPDAQAFLSFVDAGRAAAAEGRLVLFGVRPDRPATGYGYIQVGTPLAEGASAHHVTAFVEKPDRVTAEKYLSGGAHVWNSGIFLFPARVALEELEKFEPEVARHARTAVRKAKRDLDFVRLDAGEYAACPSISIDYGVLERTDRASVVPSSFAWSDVGSWHSLWEGGEQDGAANVVLGEAAVQNGRGNYVRSEGPTVAAVGVHDLVIVATEDAVLVAGKTADAELKALVERFKGEGRAVATETRRVHRPWGWFESLQSGERFQIKRITVHPGQKLSLQKHFHRSEHWVVVSGTAEVTVDAEVKLLFENESVYIPVGAVHRLANPGKMPLQLIEVQCGSYLGEDDIVRLEDLYARA